MQPQNPIQTETHTTTPESILDLAERLARHEDFDPAWLTYPKWAGSAVCEFAYQVEQADKFKTWAKSILEKTLPPPHWLAEEYPAFRDPELNKPSPNPNNLTNSQRRRIEHTRFACRLELETPLPSLNPIPKPKRPPTREEIIDLALRLDSKTIRHFPKYLYYYPAWAGYSEQCEMALKEVAKLKQRAEAILNGQERPPPWLVHREPYRWTPKQQVKTAPAPATVAEADAHLQRQTYPLIAAWILRTTSPSPPPLTRPPPLQGVRLHPHRPDGDACPALPALWQQETRTVSLGSALCQLNSSRSLMLAAS